MEKQEKNDSNETEKNNQKKSQKDMNGVIGGLVFGFLLAFVAYQIYNKLIEFPIGQILVYIIGFCAFVCFMVFLAVSLITKSQRKWKNWMKTL